MVIQFFNKYKSYTSFRFLVAGIINTLFGFILGILFLSVLPFHYTLTIFLSTIISVCFNYKDTDPMDLCTALYEHQVTVVGFGSFKENTFVRFVTINANNSKKDILNFFKVLEGFVEQNPALIKTKETTRERL